MTNKEQRIADRMRARADAKAMLELAGLESQSVAYQVAFNEALLNRIREHDPGLFEEAQSTVISKPMSSTECREFGKRSMPYGEFARMPLDQVPLDRIRWYLDKRNEDAAFFEDLRRYVDACTLTEINALEEKPKWMK